MAKRIVRPAITLGIIVVLVTFSLFVTFRIPPRRDVNAERIVKALAEYVRSRSTGKDDRPSTITLDELVRAGYLRSEDMRGFEGISVILNPYGDATRPQAAVAEARMPDGTVIVVRGDGSVQQMTQARYREFRLQSDRPSIATNESVLSPANR